MAKKLSLTEALKKYGYVGTLANSNPELKQILLWAASVNADVDAFTRKVQDSKWWKNSADSIKQYQILRATKPGEYLAQRGKVAAQARMFAAQMGVGGLNEAFYAHMGDLSLMHGWDDATLRAEIGKHYKVIGGQPAGGEAGKTTQQLRQIYASYGVPYSQDMITRYTRDILSGRSTLDNYVSQAIMHAKSRYAALAPQIEAGQTVHDIADPYMQLMANTLELPQGKVDLNDRRIQQALTARDEKGQPTVKALWQFEQDLKASPEWDKTKNATNAAYDMVNKIGKDWGFL